MSGSDPPRTYAFNLRHIRPTASGSRITRRVKKVCTFTSSLDAKWNPCQPPSGFLRCCSYLHDPEQLTTIY